MRSYEEISKRIMQKGDEIIESRRIRSAKIKHTSYAVSGICASAVLGIGLWHISKLNLEKDEQLSDNKIITETTETTTYRQPTLTTKITSADTTKIHTGITTTTALIITETKTAGTTKSTVTETFSPLTTNALTAISSTANTETQANTSVQTTASSQPITITSAITTTEPSGIVPATTSTNVIPSEPSFFETFPTIWLDNPDESFDKPKILRFCSNNVPQDRIGTFICSEHITNQYIDSGAEVCETDIELYELENVSRFAAVVVKFTNTDDFGIYVNSWYHPDTLDELINDLNLSADDFNVNSDIGTRLWELMLSDTSLPNVIERCKAEGIILINEISFNMTISSIGSSCFFGVTKDGYIYTNSAPLGAAFYIGTDKANELILPFLF